MKWKGFINKLEEIYEDITQTDDSTIYMENNLIRIVRKTRDKINLYFHADINPAFSAETGLVIASMQSDFNFELDEIEVFYYSNDSIYRGKKALEESEMERVDQIKIDVEYQNILENLNEDEMIKC